MVSKRETLNNLAGWLPIRRSKLPEPESYIPYAFDSQPPRLDED